jgi:formylglycine-generating enzyme required for sulfatase activity
MRNAAGNNGQSGSKAPLTAAVFEKALQGFSIGDLPYADVQTYLTRLLTGGVSAEELLKVLRRRELVEPLPEYARLDISRVLIERTVAPAAEQPVPEDPGPTLGHDSASPVEVSAAPANSASLEDPASGQAAEAPAASSAIQSELLALRGLLAARDATIAELAGAVDDRDATSVSVQAAYARVLTELEEQARSHEQLEAALASERARADALAAELAALRAALESEKRERRAVESALAESSNAEARRESERHQATIEELRGALDSRDADLDQIHRYLKERADQFAALQTRHAEVVAALEERREAQWRLQADLEASRAHAMALEANLAAVQRNVSSTEQSMTSDLKSSQDAVALLNKKNVQLESELIAAKSQATGLRTQLQEHERLIERLQRAAHREPSRAAAAAEVAPAPVPAVQAQPEPSPATPVTVDEFASLRIPPAAALRAGALFGGDGRWKIYGAAVVLTVLMLAVWSYVHQKPATASAAAPAAAVAAVPGSLIRDCPACPTLTVLPAGRFKQGSARADRAAQSEKPLHWVSIAHPFAMSTNPVTVDNFAAFIAATHRDMKGCDTYDGEWRHRTEADWQHPGFVQTGNHPVTCVSWSDAKAYAEWLSAQTGQHYRLPSASEWEYAARSGGESAQPWNSDGSGACANANVADKSVARRFPRLATFACDDGYVFTAPVGSFKASAFGLNDVLGNVFQWTEDCWAADYIHAPVDGSARVSTDCAEHEIRGGSWSSNPGFVRANARNHFASNYRASSFGIRLVREVSS